MNPGEQSVSGDKPRVCFVSKHSPQRYKALDFELLARHFRMVRHDYAYTPANVLGFRSAAKRSDVVFAWFASPWLAIASVFIPRSVKLVIVAGGYDVADCRELKHGARFHFIRGRLTRFLLKRADVVLPVSEFNSKELLTFVKPQRSVTVPNAVDIPEFSLLNSAERPARVITVGIMGAFISKCKGHHRFLEVARLLPEYEFILMGRSMDDTAGKLRDKAPPNVRVINYTGRNRMIEYLLSSSVYLQLSYYESFGVSVAEAVVCGCYPVVAGGTALTEITCGMGDVVRGNDIAAAAECVHSAVETRKYRKIQPALVRAKYSVRQRENALLKIIQDVR